MSSGSSAANPRLLLRALIADDHTQVNADLTALLSDIEGLAIFGCAQEPARVLALVESVRPDVVILDLNLPGPVGLKTLRAIKAITPAPVVIVLSHYEMSPLREASRAAGADYFLEKTHAPEQLRELLTGLASRCPRTASRTR